MQPKPKPTKFNGQVVLTTVGRCIFNDILPEEMPFYNYALTSAGRQPRDRRYLRARSAGRRRSSCWTT